LTAFRVYTPDRYTFFDGDVGRILTGLPAKSEYRPTRRVK